jgi:hypothetical protein
MQINHRDFRRQRIRRRDVQAAQRDSRDEVEVVHLRIAHGLKRRYFFVDYVGSAPESRGMADEPADVDVDRRADRGPSEGKVAELDGAQTPERFRQPEIAVVREHHASLNGAGGQCWPPALGRYYIPGLD